MKSNSRLVLSILLGVLCILTACAPSGRHHPERPIADPNQRLELERISFLPPRGHGWKIYYHRIGIISLTAKVMVNNISRSFKVALDPFDSRFPNESFDKLSNMLHTRAKNDTESIRTHRNGMERAELSTAQQVVRGGMQCMKTKFRSHIYNPPAEFSIGVFGGGTDETTTFICRQPHQPSYLPYLTISLWQLAPAGVSFLDEEYILEPIFKSLKFKPVDIQISPGYRKRLELNARAERIRKGTK